MEHDLQQAKDADVERLQKNIKTRTRNLKLVGGERLTRFFVKDNRASRKVLGNPPPAAEGDHALEMAQLTRWQAMEDELQKAGLLATSSEVEQELVGRPRRLSDSAAAELIEGEFRPDPLAPLRVRSEKNRAAFLELDRKRSERELRLAASLPVLAIGIQGAARWHLGWLILAVIAATAFLQAAGARAGERQEAMAAVRLSTGLTTPALEAAAVTGREMIRQYEELKGDDLKRRPGRETAEGNES